MAKIIEARAVLAGEDKLSPLLDKLAKKLAQAERTAKTSEKVDKMAASLARVNKQMTAIEKFNAAKIGFVNARQNFREAEIAVDRAARAMKNAEGPAKQLEAQYLRAQSVVKSAARAFDLQKNSIIGARRALDQAGIPLNRLASEQQRLASAVNSANAALDRQGRARRHLMPAGAGQFLVHGAATYVSAHAVARGIKETALAGARVHHERTALLNAGRTPQEMKEIERASSETVRLVPTSTFEENLKVINETTGSFGTVEHAIENLPFMQKAASVLHAAAGDKVKDSAGEMGNKMARFFEMRGTAIHSETFRKEAEQMIRAMAFTRGNFNPSEMLNFGQQATPGTLANYNERFLTKIAPSLATEFGGDRAGTAANAFRNVIMGKANDKKQAEAWVKLGLLNKKMAIMKGGHAVSWTAGAVKATDIALRDPLEWAEKILIPALRKHKVDTDNPLALTKALGTMFRNSMANRWAEAITQDRSRQRLHKDEKNINAAGDLDTIYNRNLSQDPTVAIKAFTASLDNIMAAASSPAMKVAAGYLTSLAGALQEVALVAKEYPKLALGGAATAGGLALAIPGWMTYKLFTGFGLTHSATALDGSAAALNAAAIRLGGGATAATAMSGGAVAGDAVAKAAPFALGALGGGIAFGAWELGQAANNVVWNNPKAFDTSDNPMLGAMGGDYSMAAAIAKVTQSQPIEADLKGSAEVKGEAKITIDIPGLPSRTVDVPLRGTVNANGPGSLGVSSPDAAAHPVGVGHN